MSETPRPEASRRGVRLTVAAICLVGGLAPLAIYWAACGNVASVTPEDARALLDQPKNQAVLVDVRPVESFLAGRVDGAVNWPYTTILTLNPGDKIPSMLRDRPLLLICDTGIAGRESARHLHAIGVTQVANVRGGMQEWARSFPGPHSLFRESPPLEQAVAVAAYFFVKPIYTLLALGIVIVLWMSREPDLVALRWSMIWFFIGENACAANYALFRETSYLAEYLHSLGMLYCFGFAAYAIVEGIDRRILGLSDPERRCAALGLCGQCIKTADVPCGLKRVFFVILPALIVVTLMLPTADWQDTSYHTLIFGKVYHYAHLRIYQQFENWYCALAALAGFSASFLILVLKTKEPIGPAKIALAAGLGPLAFGLMRVILGGVYDNNRVWYLFWEEATEFLFIAGICLLLWIFRHRLLPRVMEVVAAIKAAS
jgi:rhodanese-related sulfurtransferase